MKIFTGWTIFEKVWLITSTLVITTVSIVLGDNWLGFISAITGILCVVMAAKGKIATYYFGTIQATTYTIIAYENFLYGEAMLNALFFLPMQFVGWYLWKKNRNKITEDVYGRRLTIKNWVLLILGILIASGIYSIFLNSINAAQVGLDSFAVVISLFAQLLMALRFAEQWLLWITVNVLTISLWFATLTQTDSTNYAIFVMWCAFLINSVYGYLNWRKISKTSPELNQVK